MLLKELQIVSFDNPYPPNYGGAIDVFYKIKALSNLGVTIHLHAFYDHRCDVSGLEQFCSSIKLYKRNKSIVKHFSLLPFSVNTRVNTDLIQHLKRNKAPILFESLICSKPLDDLSMTHKTIVRCHNIEHDYSLGLSKSEQSPLCKLAFYIESLKLKRFEKILNKANSLLSLSHYEVSYFEKAIKSNVLFTPVFQGYESIAALTEFGDYALYHGDLSISDNLKSVQFLVDVFSETNHKLIVASSRIPKYLSAKNKSVSNVDFVQVINHKHLSALVKKAHVNVLYSFQRSGTKLKLFSALYNGRHCIVNKNIVDDSSVLDCCEIAETKANYIMKVEMMFKTPYVLSAKRVKALQPYNALKNAKSLLEKLD